MLQHAYKKCKIIIIFFLHLSRARIFSNTLIFEFKNNKQAGNTSKVKHRDVADFREVKVQGTRNFISNCIKNRK